MRDEAAGGQKGDASSAHAQRHSSVCLCVKVNV